MFCKMLFCRGERCQVYGGRMTHGVPISDKNKEYIREAIATKFPSQIARELNCSVKTVKNILREKNEK